MGNTLTTMLSQVMNEAHFLFISGISYRTLLTILSASLLSKSLFQWAPSSTLRKLLIPGRLRFSISPFLNMLSWKKTPDPDTVMTPKMERRYWKRSAKDRVALQRSDARFVGRHRPVTEMPPVVLYYVPALPPLDEKINWKRQKRNGEGFYISAQTYCKWHRMVFPGNDHPTICEASKLRNTHDPDELREIYRISRTVPDDEVFQRAGAQLRPWSSKYQKKWNKWLALRPGGDIVFEESSDKSTDSARTLVSSRRIRKLTSFGRRVNPADGAYDVKTMLPTLINALQ